MKRPASKAIRTKKVKKATAATKSAGVSQKKPAKAIETDTVGAPCCKPIGEMTLKDFMFFQIPAGRDCWKNLRGCKSPRKGYIFKHIGFNQFAEHDTKIPKNAKRRRIPRPDWVSRFFWDPAKRRLTPVDLSALPERACGTAYGIEDNGGIPFICYVREDGVSVFRQPTDTYMLFEDEQDYMDGSIDKLRTLYTEEVATFTNVVKTWVGIDDECGRHGNSILVHVASASKCVTAAISSEAAGLLVTCVDLAGETVTSVKLDRDDLVLSLVKKIKDCLKCSWVKCFCDDGAEIPHDQPLKEYSQLTLKDATESYVYVGSEIESFDADVVVTAYYSRMGNSSVPYPVALTPTTAFYMLDMVQVARSQLAPFVTSAGKEDWGDSYGAFYDHAYGPKAKVAKSVLANVKTLCPRQI